MVTRRRNKKSNGARPKVSKHTDTPRSSNSRLKEEKRDETTESEEESSIENEDCEVCRREVREEQEGIACDMCRIWFHIGCAKVSMEEYKVLQKSKRMKWYCEKCDCKMHNNSAVISEQKIKMVRMENDQREIKEKMGELQSEIESLKQIILNLQKEVRAQNISTNNRTRDMENNEGEENNQLEIIREEMRESQEKEKKKNNLILFNVPESVEQRNESRIEDDKKWCKKVFSRREGLGLEIQDEDVIEVIRLGKRQELENSKPRPLLVKMYSAGIKWHVIKNAKKLKNSSEEDVKKIFIVPDLTEKEREKDRELRKELERRRNNGEAGWYIKSGELLRNENFR